MPSKGVAIVGNRDVDVAKTCFAGSNPRSSTKITALQRLFLCRVFCLLWI